MSLKNQSAAECFKQAGIIFAKEMRSVLSRAYVKKIGELTVDEIVSGRQMCGDDYCDPSGDWGCPFQKGDCLWAAIEGRIKASIYPCMTRREDRRTKRLTLRQVIEGHTDGTSIVNKKLGQEIQEDVCSQLLCDYRDLNSLNWANEDAKIPDSSSLLEDWLDTEATIWKPLPFAVGCAEEKARAFIETTRRRIEKATKGESK